MQIGIFFDQSRCSGCYTCIVACKDWHDIPAGPVNWVRVVANEGGKYPNPSLSYIFNICWHCQDPGCVSVCPVDAIVKREVDGIVTVDRETCTGCGLCLDACPYKAPQFGNEANATMQKCDLCLERWTENKKPICVNACPMRALDAGPIDELIAKYGSNREAEGFVYYTKVKPSVIFKNK